LSTIDNTGANVSRAGGPIDYQFQLGKGVRSLHPDRQSLGGEIDQNHDGFLQDDEIKDFLRQQDILRDPGKAVVDDDKILKDYKRNLLKQPLPQAKDYHSYSEVYDELKALEKAHPDKAQVVSLAKTHEGRDLWAIKISSGANGDSAKKPGVVFTGAHHAREWASMEAPLYLARYLLDNYEKDPAMKQRVDGAEIWIVPLVNPDGYEYTRNEDSFWRKNRRPIEQTACDLEPKSEGYLADAAARNQGTVAAEPSNIKGWGVDLNRNYYDGNPDHFHLYRPKGDTPCSTWDDFSATSDRPSSDTYRGPQGASENEIQGLLNLELGHKNIKGIIDHHGYGRMILYPWGHTEEAAPNADEYRKIGNGMSKMMSIPYRVMQSSDLYPASGSSEDAANANDILSFTIEMGDSFQPSGKEMQEEIRKSVAGADLYFLDQIISKHASA